MHSPQHPDRIALHNEIHARPPEAMAAPLAIAHIVMLADPSQRAASRHHLAKLLRDHHVAPPDEQVTHVRTDLGAFRLRWEMHTEFVTWTFALRIRGDQLAAADLASALDAAPREWLAGLPGQCIGSLDLWVLPGLRNGDDRLRQRALHDELLVGSAVAGEQAQVFTDFAIHPNGSSRFLLYAGELPHRRLGRLVQRLLEIETYRMAAMLGLPTARETGVALASAESELAELAHAIQRAERQEEAQLLDRLTRLAAQVESQYAATHSRFSASSAYFELLDQRIVQIGEARLEGLQTIGEFIDRRLTPARKTCEWATRRQDALSRRISRVSSLLRTRVEIEQQQNSQALLEALNRRQDLQLKLQATVEGLSVAAITYYIVGLVSYLAKGGQKLGWPLSAESTAALAIPLVAGSVWWSLRRLHRSMFSH
ncbi:Uncharacterized membrane-anchored protein [Variovorax sp. HW608]|uniref:DUF3422 family protein n=1 Tax=Variovorax sp. HW608 TaxID=1034889 RepID=UPI00081F7BB2|nr:DUF3422 domain-containing protein [Variovorax sp. HW608]SCK17037.1 Uncharacterized membrane-anchored protein [Variovorax sp. HW608]